MWTHGDRSKSSSDLVGRKIASGSILEMAWFTTDLTEPKGHGRPSGPSGNQAPLDRHQKPRRGGSRSFVRFGSDASFVLKVRIGCGFSPSTSSVDTLVGLTSTVRSTQGNYYRGNGSTNRRHAFFLPLRSRVWSNSYFSRNPLQLFSIPHHCQYVAIGTSVLLIG